MFPDKSLELGLSLREQRPVGCPQEHPAKQGLHVPAETGDGKIIQRNGIVSHFAEHPLQGIILQQAAIIGGKGLCDNSYSHIASFRRLYNWALKFAMPP